jgi:hypothetical protein
MIHHRLTMPGGIFHDETLTSNNDYDFTSNKIARLESKGNYDY